MNYGYIRPLADEEENRRQHEKLKTIENIQIFEEAHAGAKHRTVLDEVAGRLRDGDTLFVYSLPVLADSTRHLLDIVRQLDGQRASLHILSAGIDTEPGSEYPFPQILEALAQFQSDIISEKTKMGLLEAQKKGHSAGRPKKSPDKINEAIEMYHSKQYSLEEIREKTGISKSTLYRNLES